MSCDQPRVSVIIPFKAPNEYLLETMGCLRAIDYQNFEVILLPDEAPDIRERFSGAGHAVDADLSMTVNVVPTGPCGPGRKRDAALPHATGEILAFLDDDTFPERDWLKNAVSYFGDPSIAAIGGPAVTPSSENAWRQASGHVYASLLGGGPYAYRYIPLRQRAVDDYPTCNLLVRRSVFEQVGGFDTRFWPGEDTKLCLDITRKLGLKILYVPDAVVHHHRRPLFRPHLRQVREYALHRGYFAKRLPATSLRPSYFLPSVLVAALLFGFGCALVLPEYRVVFATVALVYLAAAMVSAVMTSRRPFLTPLVAAGIVATHLVYGVYFLRGLLAGHLAEEGSAVKGSLLEEVM